MKEHNTMTIGIDLGDRVSHVAVLDESGEVTKRFRLSTTRASFEKAFSQRSPARVVMEATTHSRWASSLLDTLGHEVLVANPRQLSIIYKQQRKNDKRDAELLARVGRLDPTLLCPIRHRSDDAHADLALVGVRDTLVRARAAMISTLRGMVKSFGHRLPSCSTESFAKKVKEHIPAELLRAWQQPCPAATQSPGQAHRRDRAVGPTDHAAVQNKIPRDSAPSTGARRWTHYCAELRLDA